MRNAGYEFRDIIVITDIFSIFFLPFLVCFVYDHEVCFAGIGEVYGYY